MFNVIVAIGHMVAHISATAEHLFNMQLNKYDCTGNGDLLEVGSGGGEGRPEKEGRGGVEIVAHTLLFLFAENIGYGQIASTRASR